ncbi:Ataxin-10 domain-containing protein [Entamoeba marina]
MDEQIPTYKLVPHINDLLNGIGDNEQFSQQCIEALNAIALRDDALSILSTKTTILTEKVQSSKDLVFSSLMLLLANMGRMDSTIEYYINSGIAETIINYVNDHPNDERSLMMTVSVLSAMSVRQTNRDYLAKTMNLFEVLNNWYYRTSNQVIIFNIQQVISRLILNSGERAQLFMNQHILLE